MKVLLLCLRTTLFAIAAYCLLDVLPKSIVAQDNTALTSWLAKDVTKRGAIADQAFATKAISKSEAMKAAKLIWESHAKQIAKTRKEEWDAKKLKIGKMEMKFDYRVFGKKPRDGRSLYISMHGGGGAPAKVNEQQWRNQIRLYQPKEGIYLAPRAPTNTWNLWHQSHIDDLFHRLIEDAIVIADVNPNKVYIMGYSAGGDGVYQLAPRMADYLAAAAMMAGHPNDAQPLGLRNIGFTLHMGGNDSAYNRNKVAEKWKKLLADLQKNDNEGYKHEVVIHKGMGHWMQKKDAVAVPWMAKFTRNPLPNKIVWRQSPRTHDRFYWLAVNKKDAKGGAIIVASRKGQQISVEKSENFSKLKIRLNDLMVDLDQPVVVKQNDKELYNGKINRNIATIYKTVVERGDPKSIFSAEIEVDLQ